MDYPLMASIVMFAGNFAPRGWAFCQGQTMQISQNSALFSLLGTTYGGNGYATFQLPDMRGRVPVGVGQGNGLNEYNVLGEMGGQEYVTLTTKQIAASTVKVTPAPAEDTSAVAVLTAGTTQQHNNLQPYLAVNFIIATEGIYPSRND